VEASQSSVRKMDLLVVATRDPERAAILYGARLGLPLSFDQVNGQSNSRLMQFPCGDMLIDVVHRPEDSSQESDRLWGIAWSVADADAARDRLLRAGRNVSDVKVGAKPDTRVFTVRDGTCNVATLVVEHLPAHRGKAVE
jgi:predicted enzyme related to lactoylglutathione lyase